ncbi:MAG: hypothetical protein ACI8TA_003177 [Cyclobacteriaceae bacterium]|jgi:hypothetical protein
MKTKQACLDPFTMPKCDAAPMGYSDFYLSLITKRKIRVTVEFWRIGRSNKMMLSWWLLRFADTIDMALLPYMYSGHVRIKLQSQQQFHQLTAQNA